MKSSASTIKIRTEHRKFLSVNMNSKVDVKVIIGAGLPSKPFAENTAVDFEKAVSLTGFGRFHYLIIILCGSIFCCVGFQNGLNAYVMPSAECDLKLSSGEKGLLNAVFLGGGLSSAFLWGILADHVGRKKVLVFCLISDGIITIISSFSQSFLLFATFRFLNGFLIGAPGSIIVPYLGEFLGNRHRAPSLCAIGFFWTISWMILPATALGIIPIKWFYKSDSFLYNSWRIYVALFAIPTLTCGTILGLFFPESPKYLFSQGRERETLQVLQLMYRKTHGATTEYPVKAILPEEKEETPQPIILNNVEKENKKSKISMYYILHQVWNQATFLFGYPTVYSTLLASSLMFSNMFGYYGLGLWLPELFNRFEDHYKVSNVSVSVCEVTNNKQSILPLEPIWPDNFTLNNTEPWENEGDCLNSEINTTVFINTFIIGASCLVGNVLSSLLAKKIGLKILTIVTAVISGVCAIAIYFLRTQNQNLLISCLFLTFVGTENAVVTSAIVDLFPTKVRALAVCTAIFAGRLGAVASNLTLGYVLDISCEVPVFLMGFILLCGGFLGFFLPRDTDTESSEKGNT